MTLNGYRERPRYDGVRIGALHVPEPHLVRQVLVRDLKVLTPLFYVSKPIGRSIRVQPAIRCDAINDDGGVPKNAEEKLDILGVETVDVIIDKGLDFSRGVSLFEPLQIEKNLKQLLCWSGTMRLLFVL